MRRFLVVILLAGFPAAAVQDPNAAAGPLPAFGRDTVLVYRIEIADQTSSFVVRIAEFSPNRFIEWEDHSTQGTVLMTAKAIAGARIFLNARLFEAGVDTRGKDATTLWLSRRCYAELKSKGRLKLALDGVDGWLTNEGTETIVVDVNRVPTPLPVLKVRDERESTRWFLDDPDNPLMVRHTLRKFNQTLASITTDRKNTLRWIKGRKLDAPR